MENVALSKEEFGAEIHKALQHLNDMGFLLRLDLVQCLCLGGDRPDRVSRQLRGRLLDAIESLNPKQNVPTRSRAARSYHLLYGRYVQEMSTEEIMDLLAISLRQFWREHKKALDAVTEILWTELQGQLLQAPVTGTAVTSGDQSLDHELRVLIQQAQASAVDIRELLEEITTWTATVAQRRGISLNARLPAELPIFQGDRTILRLGLVNILSYAMSHTQCGKITVTTQTDDGVSIQVVAEPWNDNSQDSTAWGAAAQLLASQQSKLHSRLDGRAWRASVWLPIIRPYVVLVIDDNEDTIEVFRRYLMGHPYTVHGATSGATAFELVEKLTPDAIILDIMMPGLDGWETLQRLRAMPGGEATPVIICSVLDEPYLAASLNASAMLAKPITQAALLTCLDRLTHPESRLRDR